MSDETELAAGMTKKKLGGRKGFTRDVEPVAKPRPVPMKPTSDQLLLQDMVLAVSGMAGASKRLKEAAKAIREARG